MNALAAAAAGQHVGTVRALAKAGARVTTRDRNGTTPLHVAAKAGVSVVAAALLELGADPTVANDDGDTPADLARRKRDFDMVKLLGKYEAERAAKGLDAAGGGEAERKKAAAAEEEEEEEEPPQVVMVSRVKHEGEMYLVDKRTGIVYSNNLDDPSQIGTWSQEKGVVLGAPKAEVAAESTSEAASPDGADAKDEL